MRLFQDLKSHGWLYAKGALFVCLALFSAGLIILLTRSAEICLLLAICVWASCRAYYFAFYVIEKYIDPEFRFAGIGSFLAYLWRKRRQDAESHGHHD